ncbi:peptide-methionine (S)-S-oxide reductase MsrA [Candidatus Daviesbacteria bacterium]|nr:peptide-methionine (S)-S-oxide reductase MsrA [Candidatus Daviesbacteria bacterium]
MSTLETATFAGGCFWCFEAIFKRLKGVEEVTSGYSGGRIDNPSYEEVSSGNTGHAEAVQLKFSPHIISYEQLVEIFFRLHDPTTLNRQGQDFGKQYRSVIFYHSEKQREIAEKVMGQFESDNIYDGLIVTEIVPFSKFYKAEDYHQDYYKNNRNTNSYCRIVIDPKIQKLYRDFKDQVKEDEP